MKNTHHKEDKMRRQQLPKYPESIDKEVIPLCDALNSIPGIQTCYSCSGHGKFSATNRQFHIVVIVHTLDALNTLLYSVYPRGFKCNVDLYPLLRSSTEIMKFDIVPRCSSTDAAVAIAGRFAEEIYWVLDNLSDEEILSPNGVHYSSPMTEAENQARVLREDL